jgi:predicted dehydrogenase
MQKLRLIQCGTGGMGETWWKSATADSPDFELVAIVDVSDAALAKAGDALGIDSPRRFRSLEAALEQTVADAVLTVTPPPVHVEHAKLAFARGLHLLTEKPIAPDMAGAKLMVQLAERAKKQLVVAQNYRYSAVITRLRSLLAEQPVGALGHGHIDFYIPGDFTGSFRQTMQFPLLVDMAIHHLDLVRAVTGRNIRRVTASTFNPSWSWYQHHAGLKMLLQLDDDLPFSYSGDWSAKGRPTSWNGSWRLQCAGGSIHLDGAEISVHGCQMWGKDPTSESIDVPPLELTGQRALLARFADAIRTNQPAETSGKDNLQSFAAVMSAVKSATEGRSVSIDEVLDT